MASRLSLFGQIAFLPVGLIPETLRARPGEAALELRQRPQRNSVAGPRPCSGYVTREQYTKGAYMLTFEKIDVEGLHFTPFHRAKIIGGWLVFISAGICFVPDPEHKWDGGSLPSQEAA